jgi:hypothetical protein
VEARATLNGASVSKTFVAAVLVLVAMGLGAMGGYAVRGLGAGAASTTSIGDVHPAAGTVLRQDNPPVTKAVVPAWIQNEIDRPQAAPRLSQDDPAFIQKYAQKSSSADSNGTTGTRGDYGFIQ